MAYDPYKSLLANATREHLKRSTDLNTHLVGNVFLPAIDSQHSKKPFKPPASLNHLKMIEQCIRAENKREGRLTKCASIKERRALSKKFQAQRERERDLIQALMLGKYPEQEMKLLETEIVPATTPRHQLNQDITGLTAKVAAPDRVFRKADFTGGVPKSKPHAHKKFTLPLCNGSPGKKSDAKAQATAAANLSSPSRGASLTERDARTAESLAHQTSSPSRLAQSATTVRSPKSQVRISEGIGAAEATVPRSSPHRLQLKAGTTPQLTSLSSKPVDVPDASEALSANVNGGDQPHEYSSVALSFSEVKQVAMDTDLLKATVADFATQTTPRMLEDNQEGVKKAIYRPELPPILAEVSPEATISTPRRPQSCRAVRATRQSFLENLAKETAYTQDRKEPVVVSSNPIPSEGTSVDDNSAEQPSATTVDENSPESEESTTCSKPTPIEVINVNVTSEEQQSTAEVDDKLPDCEESNDYDEEEFDPAGDEAENASEKSSVGDGDSADDDLETDVAEIIFDMVDMVDAANAEEERQEVVSSPRTVSPRPRSSTNRATEYVLRIQSQFRGYRARIAFRLALYEDALSCGVLGAMPGTTQGRSGWYLDPKRLMAYYFSIPEPDGEWEQKYTIRCSRLVLTPFEMRQEVLSKASALLLQSDVEK